MRRLSQGTFATTVTLTLRVWKDSGCGPAKSTVARASVGCLLILCFAAGLALAQSPQPSRTPRRPLDVSEIGTIMNVPMVARHASSSRLSASTRDAVRALPTANTLQIHSVPFFDGLVTFQGQNYPFSMIGRKPQAGGTTRIDSSYLAISFLFDEFVDENGNNIVIEATGNTKNVLNGPDFERFSYSTGYTQFSDAVQRAEFFTVLQGAHVYEGGDSWHTLLEAPRQLKPVTIEVPFGLSAVFTDGTNIFAFVDINFLDSQLNTLVQTEDIRTNELPLFVTHNTIYADFLFGGCCVGGFHTAIETTRRRNDVFVQLLVFATSLDAEVANDLFGDATVFADVGALSHEITEAYNDPFLANIVPSWQFPGAPSGTCSNVLETGDPIELLPGVAFPVMVDGFLYHPQTEALLQWFSRESPSGAINGVYSYPGNNLTSPSQPCPAQ